MLAQVVKPDVTFSDDDCLIPTCLRVFLLGPTAPHPGSVQILAYVVPRDAPTIVCHGISLVDFVFPRVGWQVIFAPSSAARWHGFLLLGPTEFRRDILLLSRTGPWRGNH